MASKWTTVAFGEIARLEQGLCFNKKTNHLMAETGIPLLRIGDLINNTQTKFVDEDRVPRKFIAKPQDIIYSRTGQVGLVFKGKVGVVHNNCFRIIPQEGIERDYVYWYLKQPSLIQQARSLASGAAQPDLGHDAFKSILFSYPEQETQCKIAAILSTYDDLIENNLRRIKILEEIAQHLYREWFVKFRYPGHRHARFTDSPLGKIPEGWWVATVGEIASNFDRLRKPLSSMQRAVRKGTYPYYGAAKIFDYIDGYIFDGIYLLVAEDGSVVTPDRKPVLQYVSGKFWANNHTHILQGKGAVSTEFLYMVLSEVDIAGYITGAAQPKITQANLNRIPVVVADDSILQAFNAIIRDVLRQKIVLGEKTEALRRARDLLLPSLISGEVDVSQLKITIPEEVNA